MNKLRVNITILILIFAIFAINGSEFLHHHDFDETHKSNQCHACLVYKTLQSASIEKSDINLDLKVFNEELSVSNNGISQSDFFSSHSGRSPPLVSHF